MKVDKIANGIIERTTPEISKTLHSGEVGKTITEFNDKAGDIAGRVKVGMENIEQLDIGAIMDELGEILRKRNFCQKTISYIRSFCKQENAKALLTLAKDPYADSRTMMEFACFATKDSSKFLEEAAKLRDYEAAQDVRRNFRSKVSEAKDMRAFVEENFVPYSPVWNKKALALTAEDIIKAKTEIETNLRNRGLAEKDIQYIKGWIRDDSVDVIRLASADKNIDSHLTCLYACHANAENADLLLRSILTKQYSLEGDINWGKIRKLETIDAKYLFQKRFASTDEFRNLSTQQAIEYYKNIQQNLNDKFSDLFLLMMEDSSIGLDFLNTVGKHINNGNKDALKEAFLKRDFEAIEKICGEKFNPRELDFARTQPKFNFNITSPTGKITRKDFVRYMDDKLVHLQDIDPSNFKDSEIRNLAKLLGTTEEQVLNMDKKEYRRLCIKFHPDRNPNDELASPIFRIVNMLYLR